MHNTAARDRPEGGDGRAAHLQDTRGTAAWRCMREAGTLVRPAEGVEAEPRSGREGRGLIDCASSSLVFAFINVPRSLTTWRNTEILVVF